MPAPPPVIIRAARVRLVLMLAFSVLFALGGVAMIRAPDNAKQSLEGWVAMAFFGLCAVVAVVLMLRPMTLRLDPEGFELSGGLIRAPRRVAWSNAERFRTYRLPRGGSIIGYDKPRDLLAEAPRGVLAGVLGVDGSLPGGWTMSLDKVVALLNDYRAQSIR